MIMRWIVLQIIAVCFSASCLALSDNCRISVLTIEPGNELYSIFGHTAIRVNDSALNIDKIYNFGTFDFSSSFFYVKFIRGDLNYFLSVDDFETFRYSAKKENRRIYEQILDLTPDEKNEIYFKLEQTYNTEDRFYKYDFFYDNCATRVRDAILNIKHEQIEYDTAKYCCLTFRELIKPYISDNYWIDLGINLALGNNADNQARSLDFMFLPDYIFQIFRDSNIVEKSDILMDSSNLNLNLKRIDILVLIFILLLIYFLLIFKRTQIIVYYVYNAIIAIVGLILTLFTLFSENSTFRSNFNIIWTLPALLIILLSGSKFKKKAELVYMILLLLTSIFGNYLYPGFSVVFIPWIITLIVIYVVDLQWINKIIIFQESNGMKNNSDKQ